MPRKSRKSYVLDGTHAFMPTDVPGIYAHVHPCVLFVSCDHCDAKPGERCSNSRGVKWTSEPHYSRRLNGRLAVMHFIAKGGKIFEQ